MNTLIKILSIALVLFSYIQVNAQRSGSKSWSDKSKQKEEVVVYLNSGTMFSGVVKEWKVGELITIVTEAGNEYTFEGDKIDRVVQLKLYEKGLNVKFSTPYNFKESGMYYSVKVHFIKGNSGDRANRKPGLGFSALVGRRFHRLAGVGIGIGYDAYNLDVEIEEASKFAERVIPLFAEVSGYFTPKHTSFSYGLAAGYSLALENDGFNIEKARGGLMVHPTIGIRFGKSQPKLTIDAGYRFQKATFTYRNAWDARSRREERLLYKRFTLRIGVLI